MRMYGQWFKSSRSPEGGSCVEALHADGGNVVSVRDSKDPKGPVLNFTTDQWNDFIDRVRGGQLDLPAA